MFKLLGVFAVMNMPIRALAFLLSTVISYQPSNLAEIFDSDVDVFTRCDDSEVVQALHTLLIDPGRRHSMGLAARRIVQSQNTWSPIVEKLSKQYEAVIVRSFRANPRVPTAGLAIGERL